MIGLRRFSCRHTRRTSLTVIRIISKTARSMNVEHFDAQAGRFDGRFGDGVGNIVKLEIEKNLAAEFLNQPHRLRPGMGEQLLADLEHADFAGKQPAPVLWPDSRLSTSRATIKRSRMDAAFSHQLELGGHVLCLDCLG